MHAPVKKPVVVVAEDDPIAMRVVAAELEASRLPAVTCSDGITALEYVVYGERLDALIHRRLYARLHRWFFSSLQRCGRYVRRCHHLSVWQEHGGPAHGGGLPLPRKAL